MSDGAQDVVIGQVGRPHGVHGELRVFATGPSLGTLGPGDSVGARRTDAVIGTLVLSAVREMSDSLLVRFAGVESREQAAGLVGAVLTLPESQLPVLSEHDEFYVRELLGCEVRLMPSGRGLGMVTRVHEGAANDSLEVTAADGGVTLVPFTHDAVVAFDRVRRTMHVRDDLFGGGDA